MRSVVGQFLKNVNSYSRDSRITNLSSHWCRSNCTTTNSPVCWKCGTARSKLSVAFCDKCKIIQRPVDTQDYFKVFSLKSSYDLNVKELTRTYRKMQSLLHPDKFANKSADEKSISEEYSSLVNKAYQTLASPLDRALHLLKINGGSISEDDTAKDQEFLVEIMGLNEEVEEASTSQALVALNDKNNHVLNELGVQIAKSFAVADIAEAKMIIIKMKYYSSLSARINNLLRERGVTS